MEGQKNKRLDEESPDGIVAPLTINEVNTDIVSTEDEAELVQIWQHEPSLRESVDSTRESADVISATMRP
jgi:hypothetical protein